MRGHLRIGLLIGALCLIPIAASAGRFSISVGYDAKHISGKQTYSDSEFDITSSSVTSIERIPYG